MCCEHCKLHHKIYFKNVVGGGRYSENYFQLYGNAAVVLTLPTPSGKGASKFFDGVGSVSADLGGMILATD